MVFRDRQFIGWPCYCAANLLKSADNLKDKPSIRHKVPTVLTELEEQIICEFSRTTQLTFWRVFYCFKHWNYFTLSKLAAKWSRSNLYRCLARNGLNKLPEEEKQKTKNKKNQRIQSWIRPYRYDSNLSFKQAKILYFCCYITKFKVRFCKSLW